eukprot:1181805-Rhodomonas_salina.1
MEKAALAGALYSPRAASSAELSNNESESMQKPRITSDDSDEGAVTVSSASAGMQDGLPPPENSTEAPQDDVELGAAA